MPQPDLLALALPKLPMAAKTFNPLANSTHGGTLPPSVRTDLHRRAVYEILQSNPEINDRMRVELALPARLMHPWTQKCNRPWPGTDWDDRLMTEMERNYKVEIGTTMIGLTVKDQRKLFNRLQAVAESVLFPMQAAPVNVRPSNLTIFMTCSFAWQQLVNDGKIELEDGSLFHRTYEAMADQVAWRNDTDSLVKARKAALKRVEVMLAALKQQGYYP